MVVGSNCINADATRVDKLFELFRKRIKVLWSVYWSTIHIMCACPRTTQTPPSFQPPPAQRSNKSTGKKEVDVQVLVDKWVVEVEPVFPK